MDGLGPLAALACLASVGGRWLFACHGRKLRGELDAEREACRGARMEMEAIGNRLSLLGVQLKQLKSRKVSLRRALESENKAQEQYIQMEADEREKAAAQEELMRTSRKMGRR